MLEETAIENYFMSCERNEMDFSVIYAFISSSYWAQGIPPDTMRRAMDNSLCFGVFTSMKQQVGFARVVTDSATFAYLADVFILEEHRGKGLGKWLMASVMAHPHLQNLRRMILVTRDAHGLYEPFGFKPLAAPERYMENWYPDVYKSSPN